MHETSGTCRSKPSLSVTFIKFVTYLTFEPVNMFMHNCNIFLYQTCDENEIGIIGSSLSNDAISVSIRCMV
jgi:hypothetical protein